MTESGASRMARYERNPRRYSGRVASFSGWPIVLAQSRARGPRAGRQSSLQPMAPSTGLRECERELQILCGENGGAKSASFGKSTIARPNHRADDVREDL